MSKALLVIDMQKKFYKGTGKKLMDEAILSIKKAVQGFREKGAPVVWIKHSNKGMGLLEGQPGFEILDALVPQKNEAVVVKTKGNGFLGTNLGELLQKNGVTELFVCGYAAEACVNHTYNGAKALNYEVRKVRKAIASGSKFLLGLFNRMGKYVEVEEIL